MPRLTHEEADKQIREAMVEPASMKVQRFRDMIAQRGGQAEQPFAQEPAAPRQPRPPEQLPARTQV